MLKGKRVHRRKRRNRTYFRVFRQCLVIALVFVGFALSPRFFMQLVAWRMEFTNPCNRSVRGLLKGDLQGYSLIGEPAELVNNQTAPAVVLRAYGKNCEQSLLTFTRGDRSENVRDLTTYHRPLPAQWLQQSQPLTFRIEKPLEEVKRNIIHGPLVPID